MKEIICIFYRIQVRNQNPLKNRNLFQLRKNRLYYSGTFSEINLKYCVFEYFFKARLQSYTVQSTCLPQIGNLRIQQSTEICGKNEPFSRPLYSVTLQKYLFCEEEFNCLHETTTSRGGGFWYLAIFTQSRTPKTWEYKMFEKILKENLEQ